MQSWYYWYATLPASVDAASYASADALLDALRQQPLDRFTYITTQAANQSFYGAGQYVGFGLGFRLNTANNLEVTQVFPDSPADQAGVERGDTVTALNGTSVPSLVASNQLNAVLGAGSSVGATVVFTYTDLQSRSHTANVTSAVVTQPSVSEAKILQVGSRKVGYFLFNSFIDTTMADLTINDLTTGDQFRLARRMLPIWLRHHQPAPDLEYRPPGRLHSKLRDSKAISHHYDVSNRFYEWVLGSSIAYTCAVYPTASSTLEEAQTALRRSLEVAPRQSWVAGALGWLLDAGFDLGGIGFLDLQGAAETKPAPGDIRAAARQALVVFNGFRSPPGLFEQLSQRCHGAHMIGSRRDGAPIELLGLGLVTCRPLDDATQPSERNRVVRIDLERAPIPFLGFLRIRAGGAALAMMILRLILEWRHR
jgi:hypothetical protein